MNIEFQFSTGDKVADTVTGFGGTVTACCVSISGRTTYCVQPPADAGQWSDARWFDETRLKLVVIRAAEERVDVTNL